MHLSLNAPKQWSSSNAHALLNTTPEHVLTHPNIEKTVEGTSTITKTGFRAVALEDAAAPVSPVAFVLMQVQGNLILNGVALKNN